MALETVVLLEFLLCRGDNTNEIKQREVQRRENVDKNKKWPGKETLPEDRITCDGALLCADNGLEEIVQCSIVAIRDAIVRFHRQRRFNCCPVATLLYRHAIRILCSIDCRDSLAQLPLRKACLLPLVMLE